MATDPPDAPLVASLHAAERVSRVLSDLHVDTLLIGAVALAAHQYPRATQDIDLAIAVPPSELSTLAKRLEAEGFEVEHRKPDADDPLGGVLDIRAPGADLVQVVNFDNSPTGGFPRLVHEGLANALPLAGTALSVVDLHTLIAFKLYAGGPKSKLDILELLDRNRPVDLEALRERCRSLGLGRELERVLALLDER